MMQSPEAKARRRQRSYDGALFNRIVGARMANARDQAKLSVQETADRLGFSIQQIYRYEAGITTCEPYGLHRFAKLYGCQPGDFVNGIKLKGAK